MPVTGDAFAADPCTHGLAGDWSLWRCLQAAASHRIFMKPSYSMIGDGLGQRTSRTIEFARCLVLVTELVQQ